MRGTGCQDQTEESQSERAQAWWGEGEWHVMGGRHRENAYNPEK